jgi:hypothetical protein
MAERSTPTTVLVRDDKHAFHLDEQQLCACSPVFLSMLRSGFKEAEKRIVLLPEGEAEAFRVFEYGCLIVKNRYFKTSIAQTISHISIFVLIRE